jgi:flagellar protein FliL
VLNPAGTGGTRFLMVSVAIETKDAATNDEMNARDAEVRDLTLRLLGSKTVDQLADVTQRDAIRHELLGRLSKLFAPGAIRQLYFPQFVIQ